MIRPECDKPILLFDRSTLPLLAARGFYYADGVAHTVSHNIDRNSEYALSMFSPFRLGLFRKETFVNGELQQPYFLDEERADSFFVVDDNGECRPLFFLSPCEHCDLCHARRREDIASRLDAEATLWSCPPLFVTLTYNDEHLPDDGLSQEDIRNFLKRLKYYLKEYDYNAYFRYFLAGEYGHDDLYIDRSGRPRKGTARPHYHAIFYGISVQKNKIDEIEKIFQMAWSEDRRTESKGTFIFGDKRIDKRCYGNVDIEFQRKSGAGSRYVSKYLHKAQKVPKGKNKPFKSFSRRPAVGLNALSPYVLSMFRDFNVPDVKLKSYDGTTQKFRLTKYFFQKVFPTPSRLIPVEQRKDVYRAEYCLSIFEEYMPETFAQYYEEFEPLFTKYRHRYRKQALFGKKCLYGVTELKQILSECKASLKSFTPDWDLIEHITMSKCKYLAHVVRTPDLTYKRVRAKEANNFVERLEHVY